MAAPSAHASKQNKSPSASARRRRAVPWWLLSLTGLAIALLFGLFVERLRFGPPFVMLCLGGAALGWASSALWQVLAPLLDEDAAEERVRAEAPHHRRELEREKQLVLKAIKEVELDFQMRKIAPEDYKDMSERYRARALRILAELDAGDDVRGMIERELRLRLAAVRAGEAELAAAASAPGRKASPSAAKTGSTKTVESQTAASKPRGDAPRACPSCGTVNDADAIFCKKCGTKQSAGAEP